MQSGIPTFSIVVPVYKVEKYLDRCVYSLVSQTFESIEIILVDDGSPDNCPRICDDWAKKDRRIKVIHKENGGLSDARNAGIQATSGKYILFVDSDDFIEIDTCRILNSYVRYDVDIIVIDAESNNKTRSLVHIDKEDFSVYNGTQFIKKMALEGSMPMAAWLYVYRRDYLIGNNLFFKKGILHEDEQFTPRAVLKANSIINSGYCAYHYVVRENSIMTFSDKRKNIKDFHDTCIELEQYYINIQDKTVREYLLDSLVGKYLSIYASGRMSRYGKEYIYKDFVKKYAFSDTNKKKSFLFRLSPTLYCFIHELVKK